MPLLTELAHRSKLVKDLDELPGLYSSPQSHLRSQLGQYRRMLPEGAKLRVRSEDLDAAVRESIEAIPDGKWQLVVRGEETFFLAETIHVPGGCTSRPLPALQLIVTKKQ